MAKYVGPSRSAVTKKALSTAGPKKVAAPAGKKRESLGQFKKRVGKMSREELLSEAEDILGDESV